MCLQSAKSMHVFENDQTESIIKLSVFYFYILNCFTRDFFVRYAFPNKHQRNFIQTVPQEIYNNLFLWTSCCWLNKNKDLLKDQQIPIIDCFRNSSSLSLNHSPVGTVNTDHSLCPRWKLGAHTSLAQTRLGAADGVKNHPFKLETSDKLAWNWWFMHFTNTITVGVGKWGLFSSCWCRR